MRVAFVLLVALACVALVAAGSGKKEKKQKEGRENKESWEGKKNYKNKESKWNGEKTKEGEKKRNKRDETEQLSKEQKKTKEQSRKNKHESKNQASEEIQQEQEPIKKKAKKVETIQKNKEEWSKKNKGKKEEKLMKKEEKLEKKSETVEEDVVIEVEEETPSQEPETVESMEGECSQEPTEECSQDEPEVTLATGAKVKGTKGKSQEGRDTAEFTGVPYAEPPQGQERLKEPVLKEWWPGVLEAKSPGSDCLQYSHFTYSVIGSEDCLYLNIYTPLTAIKKNSSKLLPVVVYIHGGAFMFFSSKVGGPKYILDKDVVLVTLNYRLGPLGFFTLGDDTVPGNLGLRDQMTALKWVQRNIQSFGGDPSRVTISGMSAGGASVHYHMLSPLSRGLFSKAISISGTSLNPWAEGENLVDKSKEVALKMGCDLGKSSESIVNCLRTRSAEQIVATAKEMQVWLYNPISPWAPSPEPKTASNPFLPDFPLNIILQGKSQDVPWLVSWTNQEGGYPGGEFVFDVTLRKYLEENWNSLLPHLLEYNYTASSAKLDDISNKIKQFYLKDKSADDPHPSTLQEIIDMLSDRLFLEGIGEAIRAHAKVNKSPIYTYRFSHVGQDSVAKHMCHCHQKLDGACHADDVGYILEALSPKLSTQEEFDISKKMVNMWYSFITTGEPKYGDELLPKVTPNQEDIPFLNIQQGGSAAQTSQKNLGNQAFWTSLGLQDLLHRSSLSSSSLRKDEL